jgi:S-adenosylmethionine decarboxylase
LSARATLLKIDLHCFTPNGGITGVAVLAESRISIHSWAERYGPFAGGVEGGLDNPLGARASVPLPGRPRHVLPRIWNQRAMGHRPVGIERLHSAVQSRHRRSAQKGAAGHERHGPERLGGRPHGTDCGIVLWTLFPTMTALTGRSEAATPDQPRNKRRTVLEGHGRIPRDRDRDRGARRPAGLRHLNAA